ncbi:hypothetical protein ACHAPF_011419 [Botrytis cinerea]
MLCLLYPFRTNSSDTAHSGFSNFSQTPNAGLHVSITNSPPNPRSAEAHRATKGVPKDKILYGNFEGRVSTSTYPTKPEVERDAYRDAVADNVPANSNMKKLNDKYKKADNMTEEAKKAYRSHRKNEAAKESDMKAEKKAKLPEKQRKYRGVPAGTKEFHEKAISLVKHAIECAKQAENLRDQMATDYIATEPSKKSADGHKKRATQQGQSASKFRDNLEDHKKAIDSFNTAETASIAALNDRMKRVAVGDQEESDTDQEGSEQPRSGRSETKLIKKGKGRAVVGDQEQSDTDQEGSKQLRSGRSGTKPSKKGKERPKNHSRTRGEH